MAFAALSVQDVDAQRRYHHGVFWGRLVLSDTITHRLKAELYVQKRTQNLPGKNNILEGDHFFSLWSWFNYQLNKEVRLAISPLGYFESNVFFINPGDEDVSPVREYRWTARVEIEKKKWLTYANRYSLEYRLRDRHDGSYQANWRARYQLRVEKPLYFFGKRSKPLSFGLSDEVFIQFGKAVRGNPNVFD